MRALLLIPVLLIAVPDRPNPLPNDTRPLPEQILGQWLLVKRVNNGNDDANLAKLTMVFSKTDVQHVTLGQTNATATFPFTLDLAKTPAVINFPQSNGIAGLVKIEGDTLTLCLDLGGQGKVPSGFHSPGGSSYSLLQLTRVKK